MTKSLNLLEVGKCATVIRVGSKEEIKRRLMDLGIASGTEIECLNRSPLGDPTAFCIKGTVIALRSDDSKFIDVM